MIFWGIFNSQKRQFSSLCYVFFYSCLKDLMIIFKKCIKIKMFDSSMGKQCSLIQKRKFRHTKCKIAVEKVKILRIVSQKWSSLCSFGMIFWSACTGSMGIMISEQFTFWDVLRTQNGVNWITFWMLKRSRKISFVMEKLLQWSQSTLFGWETCAQRSSFYEVFMKIWKSENCM